MLTFEPWIPLALWFPLALAAVGLMTAYGFASRARIMGFARMLVLILMSVAVSLPLIMLLNPTWVEPIPPPAGKPLLTVLVDRSASMATPDAEGETTRFSRAVKEVGDYQRQLENQFEIRLRTVGDASNAVTYDQLQSQTADAASTDLATGIEQSLEDRPQGQALLLVSDGIHNSGGASRLRASAAHARAMNVPIYAVTLGGKAGVRDLDVSLARSQELSYIGQFVPVPVTIRQRGTITDRTRLSLSLNGQPVEVREVSLPGEGMVDVVFQVGQKKSGLYRYEIQAESKQGEVTSLNNSATLVLRVVDKPVRVLVLEGKPYWDTKFLLRTLSSDPSVELTSIVRVTENRFMRRQIAASRPPDAASADGAKDKDGNGASPTAANKPDEEVQVRREEWEVRDDAQSVLADPELLGKYEIVVLGRDADVYLDERSLAQLKKWLIRGDGSLVCFRGPPSSQISQRLGELMPVKWVSARESRFRVQFTEEGQAMRWLPATASREGASAEGASADGGLAGLPSLATTGRPEHPRSLAVVLATTASSGEDAMPVIVYQPVGSGRVVVVEGAGMWRWAFLPPEHQDRDEVYGTLWRSLVRWLVSSSGLLPSQKAALRGDKITFTAGETASATLLVREGELSDNIPQVELSLLGDVNSKPQSVQPVPTGMAPGQFRVVFGNLPEGKYRASLRGFDPSDPASVIEFDVRHNLAERLDVAARTDLMTLISKESGGKVLKAGDARQLAGEFREHMGRSLPLRVSRTSAWDRWWVLVSVFGVWAVAWSLRRRSGLV